MSTQITIRPARIGCMLVFLGFWLVGWAFGELFAASALLGILGSSLGSIRGIDLPFDSFSFEGGGIFVRAFLLVWLTIWTVGGYFALRSFFWQLRGKEIIEVDGSGFKISRPIFGYGKVKEYLAREIVDLRLSENQIRSRATPVMGKNMLTFDYEFTTIEFAAGVSQTEAEEILELIVKRYPQYNSGPIE